jgi:hypothetical protein
MNLAFDSLQKKTIQQVFQWYEFLLDVLEQEKVRVLDSLVHATVPAKSRFVGMVREEVDDFFDNHRYELDYLTMFALMAATEPKPRFDWITSAGFADALRIPCQDVSGKSPNN